MESGAFRRKSLKRWFLGANPACHIATHHAPFSATAFCKLQLILRRCGCGSGVAEQMAGLENILMGVSYLHPFFFSADFSASAFCKVQLILRRLPILARRGRLCT